MRFYDPIAALPAQRAPRPPSFGLPETWDFSDDPMLWARTRYGRVAPEALYADAKRSDSQVMRTARAVAAMIGLRGNA